MEITGFRNHPRGTVIMHCKKIHGEKCTLTHDNNFFTFFTEKTLPNI